MGLCLKRKGGGGKKKFLGKFYLIVFTSFLCVKAGIGRDNGNETIQKYMW